MKHATEDCDIAWCSPRRPCGNCLLIIECGNEEAPGLLEGGMEWLDHD